MTEYIISALVFGLSAGFNPGPLGVLIIQQTLENGLRHGLKASLAPIITDGPIIIFTLVFLSQFKNISAFIGVISLLGGLYLLKISAKTFTARAMNVSSGVSKPNALAIAVRINFLSPAPYLFWFTVGGTYILLGTQSEAITFVIVAVTTLVLTKMLTAWIASNFRGFLEGSAYLWMMKFLAVSLAIFGLLFLGKSYQAFFS